MSNIELIELNKSIRAYVCKLIPNIDTVIDSILINVKEELDINKFKDWCMLVDFNSKTNPISYFRKVFLMEYKRGRFVKEEESIEQPKIEYSPSIQPLFNAMREKGIVVKQEDTIFIDILMRYLLKNNILSTEEITDLNHTAVGFVSKLDNPTSKEFVELWRNSRTLRNKKVDFTDIDEEYEKALHEWEELTKEICEGSKPEMTTEEYLDYIKGENDL